MASGAALIVSPLSIATMIELDDSNEEYQLYSIVGGSTSILHISDTLLMWFNPKASFVNAPVSPLGTAMMKLGGWNNLKPIQGNIVFTGLSYDKAGETVPRGLSVQQIDELMILSAPTCFHNCMHHAPRY